MLEKRSLSLAGHRTSVALEPEFWAALDELARKRNEPLSRLVAGVDAERAESGVPLASALGQHASQRIAQLPTVARRGVAGKTLEERSAEQVLDPAHGDLQISRVRTDDAELRVEQHIRVWRGVENASLGGLRPDVLRTYPFVRFCLRTNGFCI